MSQKTNNQMVRAVGRRKTASARVRLTLGKGEITINNRKLDNYFNLFNLRDTVIAPLSLIGRLGDFNVSVKVVGGGITAQAEAIRHGIARALIKWDEELKKTLKAAGFLTRDPRMVERKKYGRHKARRGHQWRKR